MKNVSKYKKVVHEALRLMVLKERLLLPYESYWNTCDETDHLLRYAYLNRERDISPFIVRLYKNYAVLVTSNKGTDKIHGGTKVDYQRTVLADAGKRISNLKGIKDEDLAGFLDKMDKEENRIIVIEKKELELMHEAILFFDPNTKLTIEVTDVDGFFSFYYEGELLKGSNKNEGDTKTISEILIKNDEVDMHCSDIPLQKKTDKPEVIVRGTVNPLKKAIAKAVVKKFPLLAEKFKNADGSLRDELLDVFAPTVIDNCLVKFFRIEFIKKINA